VDALPADANWPDQAVILAAGFSTRLRPLTTALPKCMVPVGGRPLLAHTIEHLRSYGVVNVVINLHHAGEQIVKYLGDGEAFGVNVRYSQERTILGTAGGTRHAARFFDGPFFVWYGDNMSTIRLDHLWAFHKEVGAEATVALFERDDTSQSGVAEVDHSGRIRRFVEKPRPGEVSGAWVNAGVLVLESSVLNRITREGVQDFGKQVFPHLVADGTGLYGYRMSSKEKLWWIDTPDDLRRVQAAFGDRVIEESGRT
jgi:NDP-sugar pyrophosphorylase family protein